MVDKRINVGMEDNRRVIDIQSKREGPLLDQEISIRLRPRLIIKSLLIIALLAIIFLAGRWSIDAPDIDLSNLKTEGIFSNSAAQEKAQTSATETTEQKSQPTAEIPKTSTTAAVTTTPAPTENKPATTSTPPTIPATTNASSASATETTSPATNEKIITKYSKVALAIPSVKVEIKGKDPTWGKITQVEYTIKNNEEGTIKPDYIMISQVEGYDNDYNKKIPLPTSTKTISSGKTISASISVPNGFTYSEATAGKVDDVTISFVLFDEKGTAIASYSRGYDLSK